MGSPIQPLRPYQNSLWLFWGGGEKKKQKNRGVSCQGSLGHMPMVVNKKMESSMSNLGVYEKMGNI